MTFSQIISNINFKSLKMASIAVAKKILLLTSFLLIAISASAQVSASWKLLENRMEDPQVHRAELSLSQTGSSKVEAGWKLYFNTIFISITSQSLDPKLKIRHLQGDFFVLEGETPAFEGIHSFSMSYQSLGAFLKNSHPPEALILVHSNGEVEEISSLQIWPITESSLAEMASATTLPLSSPKSRYEENRRFEQLPDSQVPPYLPSPKKWIYQGQPLQVKNAPVEIVASPEFEKTRNYLANSLAKGYQPKGNTAEQPIQFFLEKVESLDKEGYTLEITGRKVRIQAATPVGALYGVHSFLALMPTTFEEETSISLILPQLSIADAPAYGYRGFFLDVARNFQSKEQILKLLELMSFYKLNVFHFNLANDEGWRLEIPGLPELTQFGARRGFSTDEADFLWPYYGSGAIPERSTTGTGYFSVQDFQDILAFANERNIEVIPELGVPAHSRAAILAMEKRYEAYAKIGKIAEALAYRLADPEDQSIYLSAQNFTGNTVCVCQESTYTFYEKLVVEVGKMYAAAGVETKNWHTGGDEVPKGVWSSSPICNDFLAKNLSVKKEDLTDYFRTRTATILKNHGWEMGGWEEIGQYHRGTEVLPNPKFADQNWRLYAWNAVAGWGGEDMSYRLANAGYPVIICSSANFYFDLAYSWDPDERGHTWSGVVDMYQAWKAVPGKMYLSHDKTIEGKNWNWAEQSQKFTPLTDLGRKNIMGVSGQVWTETIKGPDMLEYYIFPKMLGYIERAWKGDPHWSTLVSEEEMKAQRAVEWNQFVNLVGQRELPRLEKRWGGVQFRLPRPGVAVSDGWVLVNAPFPGMQIRYTDNGNEPTESSPIYREPIPYHTGFNPRFKLFMPSGTSSLSSGID